MHATASPKDYFYNNQRSLARSHSSRESVAARLDYACAYLKRSSSHRRRMIIASSSMRWIFAGAFTCRYFYPLNMARSHHQQIRNICVYAIMAESRVHRSRSIHVSTTVYDDVVYKVRLLKAIVGPGDVDVGWTQKDLPNWFGELCSINITLPLFAVASQLLQ